jgi:hypothetical protein
VPDFDTGVPHIARIYDYWLGGTDNFSADREATELAMAATPTIVPAFRANRRFLGRAVRYMTGAGVRQFPGDSGVAAGGAVRVAGVGSGAVAQGPGGGVGQESAFSPGRPVLAGIRPAPGRSD